MFLTTYWTKQKYLILLWYFIFSISLFSFHFQISFPIKLEAIHFVYSSWLFDTAWTMIKPLLPKFVKSRIFFHADDLESLHSHIEPKYLPKRYGGIHLDYTMDIWVDDILLKNKKAYEEFLRLGYDITVLLDKKKDDNTKEEKRDKQIEEITKMW